MKNKKNQTLSTSPLPKIKDTTETNPPAETLVKFPIIGIGASAGGLGAFNQLLSHLPKNTGMAFILIQHLDPSHESLSAEILSRATSMKVREVKQGTRAEPDCVYIIPPNHKMGICHGILSLFPRTETRGQNLTIDFFFQSLAKDQKEYAAGVILSGTASDGTEGLAAIKAEGGITFAQEPKSARFDSMPQSAIASGAVDFILNPEEIAKELTRLAQHFHHSWQSIEKTAPIDSPDETPENDHPSPSQHPSRDLSRIILLLRNECHVDFTYYKFTTIQRRINRRMMLHKIEDLKNYTEYLSSHPEEVKALYADILIHVTGFFRDPQVFEALQSQVFPKIMENRAAGIPIRIWVPGCSTGEEAYSIAIALLEYLGEKVAQTPIQIFATDISDAAIKKARQGEYSESITRQISPESIHRFFIRTEGGHYKISKIVRDLCLFSIHDVTSDPPFAKIDLLSCRNLLIYFTTQLQKQVFPIFHYALNPHGFLLLGQAESTAGFSNLFLVVDSTNKIYFKKNNLLHSNLRFNFPPPVRGMKKKELQGPPAYSKPVIDVRMITNQLLQSEFPGILINEELEILQFQGNTGPFINPAPGMPSHNLLKVIRAEILREVKNAVLAAIKKKTTVEVEDLQFKEGRKKKTYGFRVIPGQASAALPTPSGEKKKEKSRENSKEYYYLIIFDKIKEPRISPRKSKSLAVQQKTQLSSRQRTQLAELEKELTTTQDYQHSLIEKYETVQENLTTTNEELQSTNEELQSTNEELETAKEELQSGNEELSTVNDELQARSIDQTQTNNDLVNLLGSVQIPIVMLSGDQKIRRFTPLAARILNLIPSDVGRPIGDLKFNFTSPGIQLHLEQMVSDVIETISPTELEVQDLKGRWYRLQSRPYKTLEGKIDGAVLTFVDINDLKLSLQEVKVARGEAEKANRAKDLFLATLSHELRTPLTAILSWAEMLKTDKLTPDKIKRAGQIIEDCGKAQASLINDLLDVSRIIVGKLSLEMKETDPVEIVNKAIESIRSTAEKNFVSIETHFESNAGFVFADQARLHQVFLNLLTNAVKFSSPQSKVLISVMKSRTELAKIVIQVADSGKGIRPDFMPFLFNRFSQEDSSSIRLYGGLGLGLALVKNLVELHGGTVEAQSPGENLGATFTITLPSMRAMRAIKVTSEPAPHSTPPPAGQKDRP